MRRKIIFEEGAMRHKIIFEEGACQYLLMRRAGSNGSPACGFWREAYRSCCKKAAGRKLAGISP